MICKIHLWYFHFIFASILYVNNSDTIATLHYRLASFTIAGTNIMKACINLDTIIVVYFLALFTAGKWTRINWICLACSITRNNILYTILLTQIYNSELSVFTVVCLHRSWCEQHFVFQFIQPVNQYIQNAVHIHFVLQFVQQFVHYNDVFVFANSSL